MACEIPVRDAATEIGNPTVVPIVGSSLSGASLIVEPADGRFPPLTPEGPRRFETAKSTYYLACPDAVVHHPFNNFDDLGPYDRCITRGVLASMLPTAYNMGNEIFQIPG